MFIAKIASLADNSGNSSLLRIIAIDQNFFWFHRMVQRSIIHIETSIIAFFSPVNTLARSDLEFKPERKVIDKVAEKEYFVVELRSIFKGINYKIK